MRDDDLIEFCIECGLTREEIEFNEMYTAVAAEASRDIARSILEVLEDEDLGDFLRMLADAPLELLERMWSDLSWL